MPDKMQAPTECEREVSADAKCLACGLPSSRIDLCDRWDCPYLLLKAERPYAHNQGAVEEALREWEQNRGQRHG